MAPVSGELWRGGNVPPAAGELRRGGKVASAAGSWGGDEAGGWRRPPDLEVQARRLPGLGVEAGGMGAAAVRRDRRYEAGLVSLANR